MNNIKLFYSRQKDTVHLDEIPGSRRDEIHHQEADSSGDVQPGGQMRDGQQSSCHPQR